MELFANEKVFIMAKFGINAPAAYRKAVLEGQRKRIGKRIDNNEKLSDTEKKTLKKDYLANMWPEDKKLFKAASKPN